MSTIRNHSRAARLLGGASLATVLMVAAGAHAQSRGAGPAEVEEVIVTGSSIRGAAPVGSNLIAVGQADIEKTGAQTIQQVLRSVPSVVGMGAVGQGSFGSADGAGTNAPTIHGRGAAAPPTPQDQGDRPDHPRPRRLGLQLDADPDRRPPLPAVGHQPRAGRPQHPGPAGSGAR